MKLSQLGELIYEYQKQGAVLVITDTNVAPLYLDNAISSIEARGFDCEGYVIPAGEDSKSFETYSKIIEFASQISLTRADGIVALGGGMVGDIAGFVAATYMRGINFYQVPTTLLAAVDSSVGGKSAINTHAGKNLVGAFHKAKFVLQDASLLGSENDYVRLDGYAEVIKTACISRSDELFKKLESGKYNIQEIIDECIAVKTYYVENDENDSGIRHILNYGHTLAHALEKLNNYEIGHGHAVAKGIAFAASLSYDLGWCDIDCRDRIHALLEKFGYDLSFKFSPRDIANAMASDKKRSGDSIKFIINRGIGHAEIKLISLSKLGEFLATYNEICPNSLALSHRGAPLFAPTKMVSAPPSKSFLHREIIAAMLSGHEFPIDAEEASEDILATHEAAKTILSHINCIWIGSLKSNAVLTSDKLVLDCKESGSTLRFMLPIVAALGLEAEFKLAGRLRERPMQQLINQLEKHGASINRSETGNITISTSARHITPGEFSFMNPESSQYISGLLFALPLLNEGSTLYVHDNLESSSYVMITLDVLGKYGIKVDYTHTDREWTFNIPGNQKYTYSYSAPEGDWSNAAFLLALGALGNNPIRVCSLPLPSMQGDMKILDFLEDFGVTVNRYPDIMDVNAGTVDVFPCRKLMAITRIDASGCPDLVPIIALVASLANGITVINNAERLRYKESDRLTSTCSALKNLGANITETKDGLIIEGIDALRGSYEGIGYGDHRIIMMLAVSSIISEGIVKIHDSAAVAKSYPNFFEILNKLGLADNIKLA
ncbi:3-dehydroquinate synthase [Mogibacterium pumilum]|nr:3-dehydroquinate synthase [Mogibacterium pumilum]